MDFPFVEGARAVDIASVTASSTTVDVVDAQNSKPATPTQLIASTADDAIGIMVMVTDIPTTTSILLDIMLGSSGNEFVILPDLLASCATGAEAGVSYFFPIFIPKASRVSARISSSAVSGTYRVGVWLLEGAGGFGNSAYSKVTAYGVVTATSKGTDVDPGATANTKGTPAELSASTAAPIRLMTVAMGCANDFARAASGRSLIDILAGSSGNEYPLLSNLSMSWGTSYDGPIPRVLVSNVPIWVPPGTRLSARAQSSSTAAGDRVSDILVYGVS